MSDVPWLDLAQPISQEEIRTCFVTARMAGVLGVIFEADTGRGPWVFTFDLLALPWDPKLDGIFEVAKQEQFKRWQIWNDPDGSRS